MGQRVALAIAAMHTAGTTFTRDVTQAYTQSQSRLERDVYLRPLAEMNLPNNKLLLALKPLCGIPKSGLHLFLTYRDYHNTRLRMTPTVEEPYILYRRVSPKGYPDVISLQIDDSFGTGTKHFYWMKSLRQKHSRLKIGRFFNRATVAHSMDQHYPGCARCVYELSIRQDRTDRLFFSCYRCC